MIHNLNNKQDFYFIFVYTCQIFLPQVSTFPTPLKRTEDEVRQYCYDFIVSTEIGVSCAEIGLLDIELERSLQVCITDIKVSAQTEK